MADELSLVDAPCATLYTFTIWMKTRLTPKLRRAALLLLTLVLCVGMPTYAQTDVASVAKKAVAFLQTRLPKPFPGVDSYTSSPETFPDSALGCAAPNQNVVAGSVPGYRFLFTVKGVIYEVRTNLDGSFAVLCDSANVKVETALSVYRTPQFSIAYPEKWTATPRDVNEVYLGLAAAPICTQPGMIVTLLGKQAASRTPDTLLDDYQAANKGLTANGERQTVGAAGRSMTLTGACTDGGPRGYRVSAYIAFGLGYRVVQFTPGAAVGQWADLFLKIAQEFSPSASGNAGQRVLEPANAPPTLFLHVYNGNLYAAAVGDLPGTPITRDANVIAEPRRGYGNARVSPDGKRVLFSDARGFLYTAVIGAVINPTRLPVQAVETGYSAAWSPDGSEIAFVAAGASLTLQAIRADGSAPRVLATLQTAPCIARATSADPSAALLSTDRGNDLLLEWIQPDVLLIAQTCSGLGVLRVSGGKAEALTTPLVRARLSPDKTKLVGTLIGKISTLDLASGNVLVTDTPADFATWSADGKTIYYATRSIKNALTLDAEKGGYAPFASASAELTLRRLDPVTMQDQLLYQTEGYAVGAIAAQPQGIAFTVIASSAALLEGLSRTQNPAELLRLAPVTQLYWLPEGAQSPTLLSFATQPLFGPPGSSASIGVPIPANVRPAKTPTGTAK